MTTPASEWLPVAVAARLAGRSPRTIWRMVSSGQLTSETIGGRRRIKRADIAAVAKKGVTNPKIPTTEGWQCHSLPGQTEIVTKVLQELRPMVEGLVRKHLEK
jgi:excisionase family DNA binding protein